MGDGGDEGEKAIMARTTMGNVQVTPSFRKVQGGYVLVNANNVECIYNDLQGIFEYLLMYYEGRGKHLHGDQYGKVIIEWVEPSMYDN